MVREAQRGGSACKVRLDRRFGVFACELCGSSWMHSVLRVAYRVFGWCMCGVAAGNAADFRAVVFGGVIVLRDLRGIVDTSRVSLDDMML